MSSRKSEDYHRPVMAALVVDRLLGVPDGAYLDLTVGGGGHLLALAQRVGPQARLYGIDRDEDAVLAATKTLTGVPQLCDIAKGRFSEVGKIVSNWNDKQFDGILLDLGISTHQIDKSERGFSFQSDGPLDMRMDRRSGEPVSVLLGRLEAPELTDIIRRFGEERMAARIAHAIVRERQISPVETTAQLASIVRAVVAGPHAVKSLARVFQSFRIVVNHELDELTQVLPAAFDLLTRGGRLAVISYHSLEDRIVKRFLRDLSRPICSCPPGLPVCLCGATKKSNLITKKALKPTTQEQAENPRSRSARLRVGEKL